MDIRIIYDKANKSYKIMDGQTWKGSRKNLDDAVDLANRLERELHTKNGFFSLPAAKHRWCSDCFRTHIVGLCL